jgi:hypothetical protein
MFPLTTEAQSVRSVLPRQIVCQVIGALPARKRRVLLISNSKLRSIKDQDVRSACANAGNRILTLTWRDWLDVPAKITVGEAQVINQSRRDNGNDTALELESPILGRNPVRRHPDKPGWSQGVILVKTETQERLVPVANLCVNPEVEKV